LFLFLSFAKKCIKSIHTTFRNFLKFLALF
jgi:hypothetical protein